MGDALDIDRLISLGTYDPAAADADDTLEYLQWLARQGIDVMALAETTDLQHFGAASTAMSLRPDARPLAELGDLGIDVGRLSLLATAFGFSADTVARGSYTPAEVAALRSADAGAEIFSEDEALYFARVTGAALARIAEAAVALFMVDIEAPMRDLAISRTEDAMRSWDATASISIVIDAFEPMFRVHMAQAIDRLHWGTEKAASEDAVRQAIGFVDLVGFSTWSTSVPLSELSLVVRRFEGGAHEIVARSGARLVKTIGDAVMFTAVDPDPVARAACSLLGELGHQAGVEARGGLTYGDVLVRGGDYYGPLVNLAARLGDLAVPGELLATPDFAAAVGDDLKFDPGGVRQLKGFAEPVEVVSLRV